MYPGDPFNCPQPILIRWQQLSGHRRGGIPLTSRDCRRLYNGCKQCGRRSTSTWFNPAPWPSRGCLPVEDCGGVVRAASQGARHPVFQAGGRRWPPATLLRSGCMFWPHRSWSPWSWSLTRTSRSWHRPGASPHQSDAPMHQAAPAVIWRRGARLPLPPHHGCRTWHACSPCPCAAAAWTAAAWPTCPGSQP
jgi:hypothetical protein